MFFRFGGVPRDYKSLVARWAVLYSIYRPPDAATLAPAPVGPARTLVVDDWVRRYTGRLVRRRRFTLDVLRWHGWPPQEPGVTEDMQQVHYLANCCPTFAIPHPITRACRQRSICPFCYAREVSTTWERIDAALPNPRERPDELDDVPTAIPDYTQPQALRRLQLAWRYEDREYPIHLVERRAEYFVPFTDDPGDLAAAAKAQTLTKVERDQSALRPAEWVSATTTRLAAMLRDSVRGRYGRLQAAAPLGAYVSTVVEPYTVCWHIEQRQLLAVRPDHAIEKELPPIALGALTRHTSPTRRLIAEAVARTCAYPRRWLFDDLSLTAIMLNARRSVRTSAFYGIFRKQDES